MVPQSTTKPRAPPPPPSKKYIKDWTATAAWCDGCDPTVTPRSCWPVPSITIDTHTSHSRLPSKDSTCHILWEVYPLILQNNYKLQLTRSIVWGNKCARSSSLAWMYSTDQMKVQLEANQMIVLLGANRDDCIAGCRALQTRNEHFNWECKLFDMQCGVMTTLNCKPMETKQMHQKKKNTHRTVHPSFSCSSLCNCSCISLATIALRHTNKSQTQILYIQL